MLASLLAVLTAARTSRDVKTQVREWWGPSCPSAPQGRLVRAQGAFLQPSVRPPVHILFSLLQA